VVFTGSLLPTDIEASYRLGANGCIQKPTSGADFNRVVGSMFNFFLSVNQLHPVCDEDMTKSLKELLEASWRRDLVLCWRHGYTC